MPVTFVYSVYSVLNTKRVCLSTLLRHEKYLSLLDKISSPKLRSAPLKTKVTRHKKLVAVASWCLVSDLVPTPRLGTLTVRPSLYVNCGPRWLTSAPPHSTTTLPYLPCAASPFCARQTARCGVIASCEHLWWISAVTVTLRTTCSADPSLPPEVVHQHINLSDRLLARASALFFNATCTTAPKLMGEVIAAPGHSEAVVNMYIPSVWKSRAAADPPTIAYGSTMCYLMRDLLTQTTKCVAHLRSHGRGVFACKLTQ